MPNRPIFVTYGRRAVVIAEVGPDAEKYEGKYLVALEDDDGLDAVGANSRAEMMVLVAGYRHKFPTAIFYQL